jgi:regulator of protease activity HflC (stomatin/prohibitin superfamily)
MKFNFVFLFVLVLWSMLFTSCGFERIDAGHTGILFNHYGSEKGVSDTKIVSGSVWYNPFLKSVYEYPHHKQTVVYEGVTFNSKEGEIVSTDIAVIYNFNQEKIPSIFNQYRLSPKELQNGFIRQQVVDVLNRNAGKLQAVSIAGESRDSMLFKSQTELNNELNEDGFMFSQISFATKLIFSQNVEKSIQGVIQAQEQAKKAQAQIIEQQALADKQIIAARADSTSKIIKAIATAKEVELVQKQLNSSPQYIEYIKWSKWDGKLPGVVSDAGIFITK